MCLGARVMCHPSVLARFACIDLFFLVRTTYIDLRHARAHMMIRYARWVSSKSLKRILRGWLADPAGQASRKRVRG